MAILDRIREGRRERAEQKHTALLREAVGAYQGMLAQLSGGNVVQVQEAIIDLATRRDLYDEDQGWQNFKASDGMYDLPFDTLNELASRCVDLWVKDPTAAQAVALTCRGAIGKGIETPRVEVAGQTTRKRPVKPPEETVVTQANVQEAATTPAQDTVDECWQSAANQRTLFSQDALTRLIRKLFCEGEVFIAVYTSGADDKVRLAMMDRREFPRVLTHPQDKTDPIAYRREWRESTYDPTTGHSQLQTDRRVAHYATADRLLQNPEDTDPEGDAFLQKLNCEPDTHILHVKVNTLGLRGIPELARILDWARGHNVSLSSLVTLAKALSTLAWTMKHDTRSANAARDAARLFQDPTPGVGSVASFTTRTDLQPVSAPTGGIANNETATRQTLLEITRPFGFGEHWYGDPSSGNLATSTSMELPAIWTIEFWQELLREVILKVLRIAVARARGVEAAVKVGVDIDFPDAQPTEPGQLATLLTAMTTAAGKAVLDEYEAAYQMLTALGVNNPQEILERQFPDGPPMGKTQAEKDSAKADMETLRQKAVAQPPPGGNGQPPPEQSAAIQEAVRRIEDVLPFGLARADDLSDRFARALQREISRWHNEVARWLRTLDGIPPKSAFDALLILHARPDAARMAEVIRRYMRMAANLGGNWAIQKLAAARRTLGMMREAIDWQVAQGLTDAEWLAQHTDTAGNWIPEEVLAQKLQRGEGWDQIDGNWGSFHLRDPKMLESLKTAGGKITGQVTDTMLADLRQKLDDSFYRQGQSPIQVAREIEDIFPKTYAGRAENIARTETTHAVSEYQQATFKANGIASSEWMAQMDGATRDSHLALDGQVRPIGTPFVTPAGTEVPMPGAGPPEEAVNCFIDGQVPIFTADGWKSIRDIAVGTQVLTHAGRFRSVTATMKQPGYTGDVVMILFSVGGRVVSSKTAITVTPEHPILTDRGWVGAQDIQPGDAIRMAGLPCPNCGKPATLFAGWGYCSRECGWSHTAKQQWSVQQARRDLSERTSAQLLAEYASGKRDRDEAPRKARIAAFKKYGRGGFIGANRNALQPKITAAICEKYGSHLNFLKRFAFPALGRVNGGSKLNARMAAFLTKTGRDFIAEHPVGRRRVDFYIPAERLFVECDGFYYHQDQDAERQRDIEILREHPDHRIAHVLYGRGDKGKPVWEFHDLTTLNHDGQYALFSAAVTEVRRWTLRKARTRWNFAVEDDESYIAKGVAVHNCRCDLLPVVDEGTQLPATPWTGQPLVEWQKQQAAPEIAVAKPMEQSPELVPDVVADVVTALPAEEPAAVVAAGKSAEELGAGYRDAHKWMQPAGEMVNRTKQRISEELATRLKGNAAWEEYVAKTTFARTSPPELVSQDAVSALIHGWAETSGDTSPEAVAMQMAVRDELGVVNATLAHFDRDVLERATYIYETRGEGPAYRAFVRAMYENTQADLKARGITEVPVYRGATFSEGRVAKKTLVREEVLLQPASSYSTDPSTAWLFADAEDAGKPAVKVLVHEIVPAENILSTAVKGFGCRNEEEVVVLGGRRGATVLKWSKGDPVVILKLRPGQSLNEATEDARRKFFRVFGKAK